jgi:hypothetical protein
MATRAANLTPKQQRNGITSEAGEQNSAQPGPDVTKQVASVKRQAEAAADRRKREASGLLNSPQGSGVAGHQVGANGDMFVWDSGLAITDVEGGGSG